MPARSHATMVDAASSPPVVWRFVAIEQSRAANFVATSAVTPAGSVAVVVSLESDFAFAVPSARTWRKRSSAVWPTSSTTRRPVSPGTEITIWRLTPLPCEATSASATPSELTRWRIIPTAWSIASLVTFPFSPGAIRGCNVTLVPPRRSRPSLTLVAP